MTRLRGLSGPAPEWVHDIIGHLEERGQKIRATRFFRVNLAVDHGKVCPLIGHVLDTLRESKEWS